MKAEGAAVTVVSLDWLWEGLKCQLCTLSGD